MNKTQLLTAGLISAVIVTLGYIILVDDQSSQDLQTVAEHEESQVDIKSAELNKEGAAPIEVNSEINSTVNQEVPSQAEPILANEDKAYARKAPPPPIGSNQSRDARHNNHQAHGHEQAPVSQQRNVNEPAPPTGANQ